MEKVKEVIYRQISRVKPNEQEQKKLDMMSEKFVLEIEEKLAKKKIKAEVFIGGSLAKGTIIKKDKYDIDVFVRFDRGYDNISEMLGKIIKGKRIHGSRDYFQIKKGDIIFEIVPVLKISGPKEARNVTDLSYFHVKYIKGKISKNIRLGDEIRLAKSFVHSARCYGAESYIKGFSGYALELLVSYYGSFLKFIRAIDKEKIILDPEKFYRTKDEIMIELNEAKLQSPIIFVDPTFKERNALAALNPETFEKFKRVCKNFLKHPSSRFFERQNLEKELKKRYRKLIILKARTNRQRGDIAGSKLKKFSEFLVSKLERYFDVEMKEFEYIEKENSGKIYLALKKKKNLILVGPMITSVEHLVRFKRAHKDCFIKNRRAYAHEKPLDFKKFLLNFRIKEKSIMKEMGITGLE